MRKFILFFLLTIVVPLSAEVKAVVFDFGGVVGSFFLEKSCPYISQSLAIPLRIVKKSLLPRLNKMVEEGQDEELFWQSYAARYGKKLPEGWVERWYSYNRQNVLLNKDMQELIGQLHEQGCLTPMLSNVRPYRARILRHKGIYDSFSPVLLSCELGLRKPDLRIYKILLQMLDLPPDEVVFVDDKRQNINAARKLGIDGIRFWSAGQLQNQLEQRGMVFTSEWSSRHPLRDEKDFSSLPSYSG